MASTRQSKAAAKATEPEEPQVPEVSEVLPGGGVAVGATLHVKVPLPPATNATPEANTPPATDEELAYIGDLPVGRIFWFPATTSVPLSEGGYASVQKVRVVGSEPGEVVVEVVK